MNHMKTVPVEGHGRSVAFKPNMLCTPIRMSNDELADRCHALTRGGGNLIDVLSLCACRIEVKQLAMRCRPQFVRSNRGQEAGRQFRGAHKRLEFANHCME